MYRDRRVVDLYRVLSSCASLNYGPDLVAHEVRAKPQWDGREGGAAQPDLESQLGLSAHWEEDRWMRAPGAEDIRRSRSLLLTEWAPAAGPALAAQTWSRPCRWREGYSSWI
jgi:hypothetical protein